MNQQYPLVSIITVVFNGEKHLRQTIESVLGQTYPNIEYIIIDGGSKDSSVSIIKEYSSRLAYWITEPDKGISDAFNKGISKAKGEIIGLINADDWYELDAVEKIMCNLNNHDVAYGNVAYWKNEKKEMVVYGRDDYLFNEMSVNHPTVFVKKDCYKRYGLFDTTYKFAMDYDLLLRLKVNNCRFTYVPSLISNMRWEGLSDKQWGKACKEAWQIKNKYLPGRKLLNSFYFLKQLAAIKTARVLQAIHLNKIVQFYRGKFSPIKKIYD